ncbi:hypothetical protein B0O80DRAFT_429027 [Mortierella sp. GBAus27b]|nr:hypothetical protein BGX31_009270 [Mortierella sp. GBA43]KAI8349618.1 hypothetical protein B0O80DRAFT_429027 [Mortierella sp. GBAus27b]
MHAAQAFRLSGTTNIKTIPYELAGDQSVVYWEDIEQVFPGVQYIENNGVTLNFVRDSQGVRVVPHCLKHHPGVVLNVFLSTSATSGDHAGSSSLALVPANPASGGSTLSSTPLGATVSSEQLSQQAIILHPGTVRSIQRRIHTVLTRTNELYESPPHHLFIVIPQDILQWDLWNPFTNRLRLYLICECGDHTVVERKTTPHCIHFAQHEGYDIARPPEFLKYFGPYIQTMHQMVKHRISMLGITVPDLSLMINAEMFGQTTIDNRDEVAAAIGLGMDKISDHVDKASEREICISPSIPDLRKLRTFLRRKDEKTLGNMYRMVTTDGYVSWVCSSHLGHSRNGTEAVVSTLGSLGSFDNALCAVDVVFKSREQAGPFYSALEEAKGVCDLKIKLDWNTDYNDYKELCDALYQTNVGLFQLCLEDNRRTSSSFDVVNHGRLYSPIVDIMQLSSIRSFTFRSVPTDFFSRSSLASRNHDLTNLEHLELDLISVNQIASGLKSLVAKAPNLQSLVLIMYPSMVPTAYSEMMEHQTCPILFKDQSMRILPPTDDTRKLNTTLQDITHLFRVHGSQIETLDIDTSWMDTTALKTLAEALQEGSRLKTLFQRNHHLYDLRHMLNIVELSELQKLEVYLGYYTRPGGILESIQWSHIRELRITYSCSGYEADTKKLKCILESLLKSKERAVLEPVQLEYFKLEVLSRMAIGDAAPLQSVLSSSKPKHLKLIITLYGYQVLALLKCIDISRLEYFETRTENTDPTTVQAILDVLEHAPELQTVHLLNATITPKQLEQMRAKGVTLWDGKK